MSSKFRSTVKFTLQIVAFGAILFVLGFLSIKFHCLEKLSVLMAQWSIEQRYIILYSFCIFVAFVAYFFLRQNELNNQEAGKRHSAIISAMLLLTIISNLAINIASNLATTQLTGFFLSAPGDACGSNDGQGIYAPEVSIPDVGENSYPSVDSFTVGWYDNSGREGGRRFYTLAEINSGVLGDSIVFNSISDVDAVGHEANFVAARENTGINLGSQNIWYGSSIEAEEGKTYLVRLFAHNNSPNGYKSIAHNVKLSFEISDTVFVTTPKEGESPYQAAVHGYIDCPNATPTWYMDGVKFMSERPFHLQYVYGSAYFGNNVIGATPGYRLSDNIMNQGILIGYDSLNGDVPGCYEYASYTLITVMPVFD